MFGKKKTPEELEAERERKAEELRLKKEAAEIEKRRKILMRTISNYVKKGWAAGDVDAKSGTATLTRATTSSFRKMRRAVTGAALFSAAKADRTETMFIYLDEKGRPKVSKSRRGIVPD